MHLSAKEILDHPNLSIMFHDTNIKQRNTIGKCSNYGEFFLFQQGMGTNVGSGITLNDFWKRKLLSIFFSNKVWERTLAVKFQIKT